MLSTLRQRLSCAAAPPVRVYWCLGCCMGGLSSLHRLLTQRWWMAASAEDADAAVTAATTALATWKRTSGAQRAAYLEAIAARVRELKPSLSR